MPISPGLRQVLNEAMAQARGSDRNREVGTEHLLASLLSTSGPPAELLRAAGLDLDEDARTSYRSRRWSISPHSRSPRGSLLSSSPNPAEAPIWREFSMRR